MFIFMYMDIYGFIFKSSIGVESYLEAHIKGKTVILSEDLIRKSVFMYTCIHGIYVYMYTVVNVFMLIFRFMLTYVDIHQLSVCR
jgi:hypothetical protein